MSSFGITPRAARPGGKPRPGHSQQAVRFLPTHSVLPTEPEKMRYLWTMRRAAIVTICAATLAAAGGCHVVRRIDQWKCDRLGICMFGVRPSQPACGPPPCPQPVLPPGAVVGPAESALPVLPGPALP